MPRSNSFPLQDHSEDQSSREALVSALPRRVLLAGGRSITIRRAQPHDEQHLAEYFDDLGPDDRNLRFASRRPPPRDLIRSLVNPRPDDVRLVADLRDESSSSLVAEAGYSLLSNGNGELAMSVARRWRNWLGPYLLDLTVDLAFIERVPNVEAQVLETNAFLLALLRARGCVLVRDDGWRGRRLMIGTADVGPTWSLDDSRPRVLVESPTGRWQLADDVRRAGMSTIVCSGPRSDKPCPALTGGRCALAEGADVVVVPNPPASPEWEAIVQSHSARYPDVPVVVGAAGGSTGSVTLDDILIPAHMHFRFRKAMRAFAPHGR